MKVIRRAALYVVTPLALVLAASYSWYRLSDTGKGWRYEDKLATYCDGLIPYEESAAFTGLNTEVGLSYDTRRGFGDDAFSYCRVADMYVTIGLIADDAVGSDTVADDVFDELDSVTTDTLPAALGGGWYGYTDMSNTGIVLPCDNKPASVVVSIAGDASHDNPSEARAMGELAAATAQKAADRWSCEVEQGGRIPVVAAQAEQGSSYVATGTCRGIPIRENEEIHWIQETKATGTAPLEECVLGETKARSEELYYLEAAFGPYAQRLRSETDEPGTPNVDAAIGPNSARATAACPGAGRAIFSIYATEYAYPQKKFLLASLRAYAERSAKQHGCTDLKLPD
ncbi:MULTISPECIES: hypothetical protein [Streptomyces]|uniref:Uncharacterized protein n=1 Tax=Streptomyces dengpaensis TaxID=2049881 RepID=A0ABM6SNH3_9ACTN|nr:MULTISPECIES: hypothetical protein [Streptomyces]AVH56167.1 hypothetical protein C4B68_10715 [Streptomyces dengpaensis]PIB07125.1 hypothetical protein B1C81_20590 [Streptomyces sp. HG99]